jgi:hypothetical protein
MRYEPSTWTWAGSESGDRLLLVRQVLHRSRSTRAFGLICEVSYMAQMLMGHQMNKKHPLYLPPQCGPQRPRKITRCTRIVEELTEYQDSFWSLRVQVGAKSRLGRDPTCYAAFPREVLPVSLSKAISPSVLGGPAGKPCLSVNSSSRSIERQPLCRQHYQRSLHGTHLGFEINRDGHPDVPNRQPLVPSIIPGV